MLSFKSLSSYPIKGYRAFAVNNPYRCFDFDHIKHHIVLIDGTEYFILAIECFAHDPPWREDEPIGLLTDTNYGV